MAARKKDEKKPEVVRKSVTLEAAKLGYGGTAYIATLLNCDPKTIRQGREDLDHLPDGLGQRVRKKGAGAIDA